jgi:glycosyltransferase involved in cell wall biosynthesis
VMKVVHIVDSPTTGGAAVAARAVEDLYITQQDVLTFTWDIDTVSRLSRAYRTIAGYCDLGLRNELAGRLDNFRPDIVHLHNHKEWGTAVIAACNDLGIPVVWSCYDYWCLCPRDNMHACAGCLGNCAKHYQPRSRRLPSIAKLPLVGRRNRLLKWFNRLDAIITLSANSAEVLRHNGIGKPRIYKIPLPVSVPLGLLAKGKEINPLPIVAYAGGEHPAKGWVVWREIKKLLGPYVSFDELHTAPSREVALERLQQADVLVFPEQWANPGPVILAEAAKMRVPIVASNLGGIPEAVSWGTRLLNPRDAQGFAEAIGDVLEEGDTQGERTVQAYINAILRHDPEQIRESITTCYKEIIAR